MSYFEEYLKKTSKTPIVEVVDPKQTLGKPLVMEKEKTKEIEIPEEPIKKEEAQEEMPEQPEETKIEEPQDKNEVIRTWLKRLKSKFQPMGLFFYYSREKDAIVINPKGKDFGHEVIFNCKEELNDENWLSLIENVNTYQQKLEALTSSPFLNEDFTLSPGWIKKGNRNAISEFYCESKQLTVIVNKSYVEEINMLTAKVKSHKITSVKEASAVVKSIMMRI